MVSFVEEEARREAMGAMRDDAGLAVRRSAGANMMYTSIRWRWDEMG